MKKLFPLIFTLILLSLIVLPVVNAQSATQNLTMSAAVSPQTSSYQFSLSQQDGTNSVTNGKYYAYTITYGAKQSASFDTTNTVITFDWSQALAPNGQVMFDYVYGSASDGYGGAKPVVDFGKRTITWTIPNLPPGTMNQTLVFQLFANSYDKTTNAFSLPLTASMTNQYVTMPEQTLTDSYQYIAPPPNPTATPGPQPTTVPTPTPLPQPPAYLVDVSNITNNSATIHTLTQRPAQLILNFGTSANNLTQSVSNNTFQKENFTTLTNLKSNTQYFFSLSFKYKNGRSLSTEIYTFHTATQALSALPLTGTGVISSNGSVLLSEVLAKNMLGGFSLLTADNPYDVTVSLPQDMLYQKLEVIVEQGLSNTTVEMAQVQPGIYTAHMVPLEPGMYTILFRSLDDSGTLTDYQLAQMRVVSPLSVSDKDTGSAIANARIFIWYFDPVSNSYKSLSGLFGNQNNPGYTDENGIYTINLPPGKYRVQASALTYDPQTLDFILGPDDGENYPHILLKKDITNLVALFFVGKDYLVDLISTSYHTLQTIASSIRAFNLFATVVTGSFALMSWLLFMLRSHSTWKYLPLFFIFHFDKIFKGHRSRYLYGKVIDSNGPLSLVRVEMEDADSKTILRHTTTNKTGKFYFSYQFLHPVKLVFTKEGYKPEDISVSFETSIPEKGLEITLVTGTVHNRSTFVLFKTALKDILGLFFEASLVISLILEILFFLIYGFEKTVPFFILSLINIILWFFYLHQKS